MTDQQAYNIASVATSTAAQVNATLKDKEAIKQINKDREFNRVEAEKARNWSTQERLASQAFNLDMWNKNNEYNSPTAQLQRMKEAGINPSSLSGNPVASSPVTTSAGSSSQASNSSGASYVAPSLSQSANMLTALGNYQNQVAQADKTSTESKWDKTTFEKRVEILDYNTREIASRYNLNNEQAEQVKELNKWISSRQKAELDLILAQLATEKERTWLTTAQTSREINESNLLSTEGGLKQQEFLQAERKEAFSKITGIPYDASDFQLAYYLWTQDKFEDYVWFALSKGGIDTGFDVIKDALDFVREIKSFRNPRMKGKGKR